MKNIISLVFFTIASFLFSQNQEKTAFIEFETETLDYGKIGYDTDGIQTFKFKNVGTNPLIIKEVIAACGCTIPTKPEKPILPEKTGEIKIKYDTKRVGKFIKSVRVISNGSEEPILLKIIGEVLKK